MPSIFLDFHLPNATTWFYLSVILAVALFFKFNRLLSIRNWDLVAVFAMVPGLLLVREGHELKREARQFADVAMRLHGLTDADPAAAFASGLLEGHARSRDAQAAQRVWWGYLTLLAGSAYWLLRCLADLALVRRPALAPNLNPAGLAWLAAALYLGLGAVALRRAPPDAGEQIGPPSAVLQEARARAEQLVRTTAGEDVAAARWWVERSLAGVAHLLVVAALVLIGAWHFGDAALGMAAATAYLLLPYLAFHMSQIHHVLPTALLLWAVVAYRKPRLAGVLVGVAAGGFAFPALAAPAWAHFYKRRGMGRFLVAFAIAAGLSLALAGLILWLNGRFDLRIPTTIGLPEWKRWRVPGAEGFWTGVHWAYRIPIFIASIAFMIVTAFWPAPKDLGHVIALSAAQLLAAQLWFANRGGAYVLWYLPLVLLMIFRPSLAECVPPADKPAETAEPVTRQSGSWALVRYFRPPTPSA